MFLSREQAARKQRMMAAYRSQQAVLQSFDTEKESLRVAPEYDFAQPPHPGKLWYEQLGWPLSGQQWRALARSAAASVRIAA
jgi:hypothetical protein